MAGSDDSDGTRLQPNLRPLRLLELLSAAPGPLTAAEVGRDSGLPRATVHRLLMTLEDEGFAIRDLDGRGWSVGPRAARLGWAMAQGAEAVAERRAILRRLAEDLGESCNLAVPDDHAMRYVERVETDWPLQIRLPVGTRVPLHCTAAGKAYLASLSVPRFQRLLAHLPLTARTPRSITRAEDLAAAVAEIRRAGHAEDDEEMIEGMVALAVPVRSTGGQLLGTVSFHAPTQRLDIAAARARLDRLKAAAAELEAHIAGETA